jgi:hypothetical protein
LEEEEVSLEGMVESRDGLVMEIVKETGLDRMGEDEDDEEEKEDVDDGGDAIAPPAAVPPLPTPSAAASKEINEEGHVEVIPEQDSSVPMKTTRQMPSPRCHSSVFTMHS